MTQTNKTSIVSQLKSAAKECADENINGFGNLMSDAAEYIEALEGELKSLGDWGEEKCKEIYRDG